MAAGGVISGITDAIGLTSYGANRDAAERMEKEARDRADEQTKLLQQQQKVVDAQKKAEEDELSAKRRRLASAQSGTSSLINTAPQGQSSILG